MTILPRRQYRINRSSSQLSTHSIPMQSNRIGYGKLCGDRFVLIIVILSLRPDRVCWNHYYRSTKFRVSWLRANHSQPQAKRNESSEYCWPINENVENPSLRVDIHRRSRVNTRAKCKINNTSDGHDDDNGCFHQLGERKKAFHSSLHGDVP